METEKKLQKYSFINLPNGRAIEFGYGATIEEAKEDALKKIEVRKQAQSEPEEVAENPEVVQEPAEEAEAETTEEVAEVKSKSKKRK